jgi:hypothetical protein
MPKTLISKSEAAHILNVSRTTLYRLLDRGKLRVVVGGVDLGSVQAYRADGAAPQPSTAVAPDEPETPC